MSTGQFPESESGPSSQSSQQSSPQSFGQEPSGQSFGKRVIRPLFVMVFTVSILLGAGLQLAKLTPTSSGSPNASPSADASLAAQPKLPVAVFNGTQITGLAKQVSDVLTSRGWDVNKVADWQGITPEQTTVYYPMGYQALANQLALETNAIAVPAKSELDQSVFTLVVIK